VGATAAALVDLSTVAGNKISNPPWVKFQSAGWVNFPSAPTKQAVIRYAAWVSPEFEDMVFEAFEAILELPEVMSAVTDQMRAMGYQHSATLLEREKDNRREAFRAMRRGPKRPLTAEQKERQRYARMARSEADKARRAGREYVG